MNQTSNDLRKLVVPQTTLVSICCGLLWQNTQQIHNMPKQVECEHNKFGNKTFSVACLPLWNNLPFPLRPPRRPVLSSVETASEGVSYSLQRSVTLDVCNINSLYVCVCIRLGYGNERCLWKTSSNIPPLSHGRGGHVSFVERKPKWWSP